MRSKRIVTVASLAVLVALTGACSNNKATTSAASASAAEKEYEAKLQALKEREAALQSKEQAITAKGAASAQPVAMVSPGGDLLPPNAKPGECYARVWIPPKFKSVTERVLAKAEGEKLEVIPAKYQWVEEKVLVSEAGEKLIPVPPSYKTVTEKVLVSPEETFWTFGTDGVISAKGANAKMADANRLNIARSMGLDTDNAKPGQCYAEYYIPAKYTSRTEKVMVAEPSSKVEVIPAKYETVTEKVLVSEPTEKVVTVPAQYKTVTEKVLVKPAYTTWKVSECSGGACQVEQFERVRGVKERLDRATGEVMCLVEVPAQYRTVTKRVMVSPPTTKRVAVPAEYKTVTVRKMVQPPQERTVEIPAQYKTVTKREKVADAETYWCPVSGSGAATAACASRSGAKGTPTGDAFCMAAKPAQYKTITKRVVESPAMTKKVVVPARYKTVKVRKMVSPPQEKRISIPAKYQTVTRTEKVSDGQMEWMPVLCQVNMTSTKIKEIQNALKKAGYYRGPIDGIVGVQTINAMRKFQDAKGLTPTRFLTLETIKALGVAVK